MEAKNIPSYTFNKLFFDKIDTEKKAYWLGFIWCDGTVTRRNRKGKCWEYCMKLDLSSEDRGHVEKFKNAIESNHTIRDYTYPSSFDKNKTQTVSRIALYNKYFGENLYYNYGMIPHRDNIDNLKDKIPNHLIKDFIRGVVDADGSISFYYDETSKLKTKKVAIQITTLECLNTFINEYLLGKGLLKTKLKQNQRYKGRDSNCRTLSISGRIQATNVISYLYKDSNISLDRKYQRYEEVKKFVEE